NWLLALAQDGGVCMVWKMRVLSGLPIASSGELLEIIDGLLWALPPPASLCPSLRGKPPASMGSALVQAVLEETVGANDLQLRFCDSLNTSRHTQATARGGRTR
uniref:Uncharacterized protein n=2 Tax=Aegilops tauschii subsp. strangulata TaxID=200361 RepID=A0A453BBH5_AEGTS